MLFTEDQDVIQALAAKRPDQAFHIWVLPGRARCDRAVAYPHPSHPVGEGLPVGTIIVADQITRCHIPRECFHDLLRQPLRRGMLGHRKPEKLSSTMAHDQKGKQELKGQGRHQAKIDRPIASAWLRRNVRHVCDGGPRCLIMYLETVDSATSKPSLSSSPWMRGAPHNGFSLLICRIRSRNSRSIFGLGVNAKKQLKLETSATECAVPSDQNWTAQEKLVWKRVCAGNRLATNVSVEQTCSRHRVRCEWHWGEPDQILSFGADV